MGHDLSLQLGVLRHTHLPPKENIPLHVPFIGNL
jgi:hypothetical protein